MKKLFTTTILAVIAAMVWFVVTLDDRIERDIEKSASYLTGVAVTVDSVDLSLLKGEGTISGIKVPNPKGYSDNNAFEMGKISIDIELGSVFDQPLIVNTIFIDQTKINLEFQEDLQSNVQDILAVSNAQTGYDPNDPHGSKRKKTKDKTKAEEDSASGEDEQVAVVEEVDETSDSEESEPSEPYRMSVQQLLISETQLSAVKGDTQWSDTIDDINITHLAKQDGISTRVIGIAVVRNLVSQTVQQTATRVLAEEVKSKVEEAGSKLLESLLNSD